MGEQRPKPGEHGAAAVEFAVILPLLLLLIFAAIEFGVMMYDKQVITNASREAARYGIVAGSPRVTDAAIVARALAYCQNYLITFDPADPPPTVAPPSHPAGQSFGDPLTVAISYRYQFLLLPDLQALFGASAGSGLTLRTATTMRYE